MQAPHAPAAGDRIDLQSHLGRLLYFTVKEVKRGIQTSFGVSDAVACDIAVLDGDQKGTVLNDVLIFPSVLRGQLEPSAGASDPVVVGRLGQGLAKPGKSAPWVLNDPSDEDKAIAVKYEAYAAQQVAKQEEPF